MHADVTAVPIQSSKIALDDIKDNKVLLETFYRKRKPKRTNLLAKPICIGVIGNTPEGGRFGRETGQTSAGQLLVGKSCRLISFCNSLISFLRLYQGSPCLGFWPQSKFFC